jgi:hypothetical protein
MASINAETSATDALIVDILRHRVGKDERAAKLHDWYKSALLAVRDTIIDRWIESTRRTYEPPNLPRRSPCTASILAHWRNSSPTPRWAMAAWAGSRPASWKAWRRSTFPLTGTASVT